MKYVTNLDLNKNELQNAVIQPLATPPSNPKAGQIYYSSTDGFIYRYNGSAWGAVGVVYSQGSTTGAVVTGLSVDGQVTTNNVINLTLTGYSPVSEGYVTTGMSLQQAIAALDTAVKNAVAGGGEVNQEAWSYIGVGSSTVSATAKKDTFNVAATGGVSVSANTSTKTITINVPVDSSMSGTSTNPVQNKVIKEELDKKIGNIIDLPLATGVDSHIYIPYAEAPDGDNGKLNDSTLKTILEVPLVSNSPTGYAYKINNKLISAEYDGNENIITSTYATKTELAGKYTKPSGGIPYSDLAADVVVPNGSGPVSDNLVYLTVNGEKYTVPQGTYSKPSGGIPKSDLDSSVQTSLGKADSAIQEESVTDVTINGTSILDNTVAKIAYETGLGSDSNNAATVTAIRNFVNSSIESVAAYYITSDAQGNAFATKAALDAGPYYYAGAARTPTRNDYAIVIADETHSGQTARYTYTDNQWAFQYTFNMGFTQAQINAINSGITAAKVTSYDNHIANTSNPHSVTKAQVGLGNVGNFKAVSTVASQGLSATEQANARANIGAGTSSFSGDYDDLTDKPTITLNGSAIKSPSFYAPTGAGSSGQVLTSSGSGAPSWQTPIKKYTATNPALTASGGAWTWTIAASTHGINNNAIMVNLYEVSTNAQVIADVAVNATNYGITVTIVDSGNASSLAAGTYRIVAIG